MVGCDSVVSEGNPKAQIVFRHITSKVSFKITNVDTNAELASAMLNGTKLPLSGKYLFEEGFVSMAANATSWINSKNIIGFGNGRHDVEFLLFPNSANCGATLGLTYKDGTMYSTEFTLPALEENCRYAYNVRVSEDSMKISSPVIVPWNNPSTMDEIVMETHTGSHAYVDLGLSVKWATCNVGATTPEDYGDYFAWGETSPKFDYSWSTYKYCEGSSTTMTKYCTESYYGYNGYTDGKTTLDLSDDAARANWGGSWRMPTKAEQDELRNTSNCTWTWTTMNGVKGYKVVSKVNGNSVFLPAAGYRNGSSLYYAGSYGFYWSSSLSTGLGYNAYYLYFPSDNVDWYSRSRSYGQSVRPVCP